jgi:hypothetical protein
LNPVDFAGIAVFHRLPGGNTRSVRYCRRHANQARSRLAYERARLRPAWRTCAVWATDTLIHEILDWPWCDLALTDSLTEVECTRLADILSAAYGTQN